MFFVTLLQSSEIMAIAFSILGAIVVLLLVRIATKLASGYDLSIRIKRFTSLTGKSVKLSVCAQCENRGEEFSLGGLYAIQKKKLVEIAPLSVAPIAILSKKAMMKYQNGSCNFVLAPGGSIEAVLDFVLPEGDFKEVYLLMVDRRGRKRKLKVALHNYEGAWIRPRRF